MCDHKNIIVVYDAGGTYKCCSDCGKQLSDWQENLGSGRHRYEKKEKQYNTVQSGIIEGDGIHIQV